MKTFTEKTAVITGAASGIGLALARRAAAQGMNLVLADIDEAALHDAAQSLALPPGRILTAPADVRHAAEIKALADAAYDRFGAAHLLCNNAGVALGRVTWEHTAEEWAWVLGAEFLPRMQAAGDTAHIVNTASAAGLTSFPGMAAYNVSKHGVVTLSETLYQELQMTRSPIGLSLLCPAWVPTGIARADRNRPADAGTTKPVEGISAVINQRIGRAIATGTLSADDMASETFKAIEEDRFYIIPHRNITVAIEARMNDILAQLNPSLPG